MNEDQNLIPLKGFTPLDDKLEVKGTFKAMAFSADSPIKQISCNRRKSNLTHQEFLDYHFQKHGAIADEPEETDWKPVFVNHISPTSFSKAEIISNIYHISQEIHTNTHL